MSATAAEPRRLTAERTGSEAASLTRATRGRVRFAAWGAMLMLGVLSALGAMRWRAVHGGRGEPLPTAQVRRGVVRKTIQVDGNLESAQNKELKCLVAGGSTLLWVVADGTDVHAGDELARLDSSTIEDQILQQTTVVERARAAKITAVAERGAAEIAVKEYLEGTFAQQRADLSAAVVTAEFNCRFAERTVRSSRRLARKGFATASQVVADEYSHEQAVLALGVARQKLHVLEEFTRAKTVQELQSRLDTAEAMLRSATASLELETKRLDRSQDQLAQCILRAPRDGLVIYANDQNRRSENNTPQIELGAFVRQFQPVLRMPNLDAMQARCLVHESVVERLRPGQTAELTIQKRSFQGTVRTVANQPERPRRNQGTALNYTVTVSVDGETPLLRPGESAQVELVLAHRADVLTVDRDAVLRIGDNCYAWVQSGDTLERRPISLGAVDSQVAEVTAGLAEGEELVLNPREHIAEARQQRGLKPQIDVARRFGRTSDPSPRSAAGG